EADHGMRARRSRVSEMLGCVSSRLRGLLDASSLERVGRARGDAGSAMKLRGAVSQWLLAVSLLAAACSNDSDASKAKAAPRAPAVPVAATEVVRRDVPIQLRAIGNVQAYSTVSVLSQVNGEVFQIHFVEGQDVKTDDLLFTIDPRPFQAALQQMQAQLAQH